LIPFIQTQDRCPITVKRYIVGINRNPVGQQIDFWFKCSIFINSQFIHKNLSFASERCLHCIPNPGENASGSLSPVIPSREPGGAISDENVTFGNSYFDEKKYHEVHIKANCRRQSS
jgi:hypothetical protein